MNAGKTWFPRLRVPGIRGRKTLLITALVLQTLILTLIWIFAFRGVRHGLAASVRDYVVQENAEIVKSLVNQFPMDQQTPEFKSQAWERWQQVIETGGGKLAAKGFACLLDPDGNILCHPDIRKDESLRSVNLASTELSTPDGRSLQLADVQPEESLSGEVYFLAEGTHYVATQKIPGTDLLLLVHQPEDELVKAGSDITTLVVGSGAAAVFGMLLLSGTGLWTLLRAYDSVHEQLTRRLKGDLQIARQIQQATLPQNIPSVDGFELAAWSEPAEETGGDSFDIIPLNAAGQEAAPGEPITQVVLLLADAAGHGVGPALAVSQLRSMLRIALRLGGDLPTIVRELNAQLDRDLPNGRFITGWIGLLDVQQQTLESFSAGQAPLLLWRAASAGLERFDADAVPFGILPELDNVTGRTLTLQPGDAFIVLTDGLFEAENAAGEAFGIEQLLEVIRTGGSQSADSTARTLQTMLDDYQVDDDRTVLIVRRT